MKMTCGYSSRGKYMIRLASTIQVGEIVSAGGKEIMAEHAGDDATQAFEDQNHTEAALDELKTLYVGEFKGELVKRPREQGPPGSLKNKLVALGFMMVVFALFMQYIWLAPIPDA